MPDTPKEIRGLPWVNAITQEADSAGNTIYRIALKDPIGHSIIGLLHWLITNDLGWAGGPGATEMLIWCEGEDVDGRTLLALTGLLKPERVHPLRISTLTPTTNLLNIRYT